MKSKHTGIRNGKLFCFNCGQSQILPLPLDARLLGALMKEFGKIHKNCKKTYKEPENETDGKTEEQNIQWWLSYGEHGISSMTMLKSLRDDKSMFVSIESYPHDPDDFRRCYLLLKAIPSFKYKLDRLKQLNPVWSKLVDNWDKLTLMLEEQLETNTANGMYEFMKELGC